MSTSVETVRRRCGGARKRPPAHAGRNIRAERASLGWWHIGSRERAAGGGEGQLPGADLYGFEVLRRPRPGGGGARVSAMTAGGGRKWRGARAARQRRRRESAHARRRPRRTGRAPPRSWPAGSAPPRRPRQSPEAKPTPLLLLSHRQHAVPAVADGVIGAAGQPLGDLVPAVAKLLHALRDDRVLGLGPADALGAALVARLVVAL